MSARAQVTHPQASELAAVAALLAAGRTTEARGRNAALLELMPDDVEVLRQQAACHAAAGRARRAEIALRDLIRREPQIAELHLDLARVRLAGGDGAGALTELDAFARLSGTPAATADRAVALALTGDVEAPVALWRGAVRDRPDDQVARAELVRALARAGAFDEAVRELRDCPECEDAAGEVAARRAGRGALLRWWEAESKRGPIPAERVFVDLYRWADQGHYKDLLRALGRVHVLRASPSSVKLGCEAVAALAHTGRLRPALRRPHPETSRLWSLIVRRLILDGDFEAARIFVGALDAPELGRLRARLAPVVDRLPDYGMPSELRVPKRDAAGVVVARQPGARGTAIVLGRSASRLLHASLEKRGLDIVHVHDFSGLRLLGGCPELGDGWAGLVEGVRDLAVAHEPLGLYTAGNSGFGYTAIRLGVELGAAGVLAFAPPHLGGVDTGSLTRGRDVRDRAAEIAPDLVRDLREVLVESSATPRIHVWYGAENEQDQRAAEWIGAVPGVEARALAGVGGHNVLLQLAHRGQLDAAVEELIAAAGERSGSVCASSRTGDEPFV